MDYNRVITLIPRAWWIQGYNPIFLWEGGDELNPLFNHINIHKRVNMHLYRCLCGLLVCLLMSLGNPCYFAPLLLWLLLICHLMPLGCTLTIPLLLFRFDAFAHFDAFGYCTLLLCPFAVVLSVDLAPLDAFGYCTLAVIPLCCCNLMSLPFWCPWAFVPLLLCPLLL